MPIVKVFGILQHVSYCLEWSKQLPLDVVRRGPHADNANKHAPNPWRGIENGTKSTSEVRQDRQLQESRSLRKMKYAQLEF